MSMWKLVIASIGLLPGQDPPARSEQPAIPRIESFVTLDACEEAQAMYRSIRGIKAKCIPDGALTAHVDTGYPRPYRGPEPLHTGRYAPEPYEEGVRYYPPNYEMALPAQRRPAGPAPWPQ